MAVKILSPYEKFQRSQVIKSLAIEGYGANKTIKYLQEIGLPIRRQEGLSEYRAYAGIPAKADTLKYVGLGKTPARASYTEPPTGAFFIRPYRYTVRFETYNTKTGETKVMFNTMSSARPQTRGAIESEAWDKFGQHLKDYNIVVERMNLYIAEHERGAEWL